MHLKGLSIWRQALAFFISNLPALLAVFPLLCVPVFADVLNTQLISQFVRTQRISPKKAIKKALPLFLPLLDMKIYFFGASLLWSFVPIYGIIPITKHRQNWAMASNVLVFEGLHGLVGGSFAQSFYLSGFWLFIIASYILIVPISGVVNTYLYLYATRKDVLKYLPEHRVLFSTK